MVVIACSSLARKLTDAPSYHGTGPPRGAEDVREPLWGERLAAGGDTQSWLVFNDEPLDAAQLNRCESKVTRQRNRGQPARRVNARPDV